MPPRNKPCYTTPTLHLGEAPSPNSTSSGTRPSPSTRESGRENLPPTRIGLHYDIQLILPESRDQAVYDALFASLRRHLF
jgi:hypothetical protein